MYDLAFRSTIFRDAIVSVWSATQLLPLLFRVKLACLAHADTGVHACLWSMWAALCSARQMGRSLEMPKNFVGDRVLRPFVVVRLVSAEGHVLCSAQTGVVKDSGPDPVWRGVHTNRLSMQCGVGKRSAVGVSCVVFFSTVYVFVFVCVCVCDRLRERAPFSCKTLRVTRR